MGQSQPIQPSQAIQSFVVPGGSYGYTGAAVDTLTSFENTLAQGLLDESSSTRPFARQMELACQEIIKALRRSPRADNLIYRQSHFGSRYREHHGFLPLAQINESIYDGCYQPGGSTTLYDSEDRVISEVLDYGKQQAAQKYLVNGIIYILTDGQDYGSTLTENNVKAKLEIATADEDLESLFTVLIGVNDDTNIQDELQRHAAFCGFSKYIALKDASEKNLAKLIGWISQQIISQSQALGTGGVSQSLTF